MKIIILGGSGFIGENLAKNLIEKNFKVLILDKKPSLKFPNLFQYFDITKASDFSNLFNSEDIIINLAAVHKDNEPKSAYEKVNVKGSENLCYLAKEKKIRHIIFFSSVAVYGFADQKTDENGEINPFNEYGRSKAKAEEVYVNWLNENIEDRKLTIIRPTVVFGPGNRGNVYNLISQIVKKRFFMIGNGKNTKSLAYVENLVEFVTFLLNKKQNKKLEFFNYIDKPDLNMEELIKFLKEKTGNQSKLNLRLPKYFFPLIGYFFDFISYVTGKEMPVSYIRLKKFLESTIFSSSVNKTGFVPPYSLKEGLLKTLDKDFSNHKNIERN
tara:strand:- start:136 stop:1116 length:981 start_codon:yes stop_codon:yes gene_type:complete